MINAAEHLRCEILYRGVLTPVIKNSRTGFGGIFAFGAKIVTKPTSIK